MPRKTRHRLPATTLSHNSTATRARAIGRPGKRCSARIREAARQRGLPAEYIAFLDSVETRE